MSKRRNTELAIRRRENQELMLFGKKRCTACSLIKEVVLFHPKTGRISPASICLDCRNEKEKQKTINAQKTERPELTGTKPCSKCGETKDVSMFSWFPKKNKLNTECKTCMILRNKPWRDRNKEIVSQKTKQKRLNNLEEHRAKARERYAANPDRTNQHNRRWKKANSRKILDRMAERKKQDPLFKLSHNIRTLIYTKIKRGGYTKKSKIKGILGCSSVEFFDWVNYHEKIQTIDEPHLDHIIPSGLSSDEEELLALNHYSNFRLISKKENLSKGIRWIDKPDLERVLNNHPNPTLIMSVVERSNIRVK